MMTVEEAIAETKRLIGEPPVAPVLRDVPSADTGGLEVDGVVQPGTHYPIEHDLNNDLLAQTYAAQLADYTARFNAVFAELRK